MLLVGCEWMGGIVDMAELTKALNPAIYVYICLHELFVQYIDFV